MSGRIVERVGLKPDGTPLGDGRHVYEYDRGRKHRVRSFNDCIEGAAANIISEFAYKVDERRNWTERLEIRTLWERHPPD